MARRKAKVKVEEWTVPAEWKTFEFSLVLDIRIRAEDLAHVRFMLPGVMALFSLRGRQFSNLRVLKMVLPWDQIHEVEKPKQEDDLGQPKPPRDEP